MTTFLQLGVCELRSEELCEGRSSQLYTQLMQLRKESLKKIQAFTGFEPLTVPQFTCMIFIYS